jgi:oligosaccharyltransferase complex subunit alpha (ribophorin I)
MAGGFTNCLIFLFLFSIFACPSLSFNLPPSVVPPEFENTAILRTVELGGSTVQVTTSYTVKSLGQGSSTYFISLSEDEHKRTSWIDAKIKGSAEQLEVKSYFVEK